MENAGVNKIDFLKIDVEGHEFEVLKGAQNILINMEATFLVEIEQRHHLFPIDEIFKYIQKYDYKGFFIDKKQMKCLSLDNFNITNYQNSKDLYFNNYVNNFLFIKIQNTNYYLNKIQNILSFL